MRFEDFTAADLEHAIENGNSMYADSWTDFKYKEYERHVRNDDGSYSLDPKSQWGIYYPELDAWISTTAEYGGTDMGSDYWVVVRAVPNNPLTNEPVYDWVSPRFFKKEGYYASFSGGEFDGSCFEVRPREKLITVYE